jgi:hypothetical protein
VQAQRARRGRHNALAAGRHNALAAVGTRDLARIDLAGARPRAPGPTCAPEAATRAVAEAATLAAGQWSA